MTNDLILITGIPGTGKTEIGEYLKEKHGYQHINFEVLPISDDLEQFKIFFQALPKSKQVVITWGFGSSRHKNHIDYIVGLGYKHIWFDGNRVASFREFMKRENNDEQKEAAYHIQLYNIFKTEIIKKISARIVNTFDENGNFKDKDKIVDEIFKDN